MRNFYNDYSNNTVTLMDGDTGLEVGAELTSAEKPNKNLGDFVNKKKNQQVFCKLKQTNCQNNSKEKGRSG